MMLFVWMACWSLVILFSLRQLRNELPRPPVRRCDGCRFCCDIPDGYPNTFREDERQCTAGRGYDVPFDDEDGLWPLSVVREDGYCDCWKPKQPGEVRDV